MVEDDIWQKLERGLAKAPGTAVATPSTEGADAAKKGGNVRRKLRILDATALFIWVFVFVKVAIADIDQDALNVLGLPGVGAYRAFIYLGLLIVAVVVFRRKVLLYATYVLFFPLLVVVWKIPALFVRRRSFLLLLATVQASVNFLSGFRYIVVSKGLALFAILFVLVTNNRFFVTTGCVYLGGLLLWSYVRIFRRTFSVSSFISTQRRAIDRLMQMDLLESATWPTTDDGSNALAEWDYQQASQVAMNISSGVVMNRGLYLWAYQLDRYRRELSPAVLFNGLSFVWLLLGTIIDITLINYGAWKLDPSQFSSDHPISLIRMTLYSFGSLYLQGAGGIEAVGGLAESIQLVTAILGLVVIAGFLINVLVTARRERDESDLRDLVSELKTRARNQEKAFQSEFAVSVDEAYRRLSELQSGIAWLLRFLVGSIPEEFLTPE